MRASMEMGRTPSLLGTGIFRGRASSYRLRTFEDCIIFDLSVLKHQMAALYGDGETGRIAAIERRVSAHEQAFQRAKGFLLAAAGVFTAIQMVIEFLQHR